MARGAKREFTGATPRLAFNHAMIYVSRLAPALHFYADRLGFKLIEEFQRAGFPCYARLRAPRGDATIALHELGGGRTSLDSDGIRLYFEVKDLDRFCKRLAAEGIEFLQAPKTMPWGWKHAYLKDPDVHELSLYWAGAKRLRKTSR
jgi:catechol 2,3-dioxygenase-like lactoylglutathione lyase family enzyme